MKINITDKEIAKGFYNMYINCIQYNEQLEKQNLEKQNLEKLNCNEYYKRFKFYVEKYMDSKNK